MKVQHIGNGATGRLVGVSVNAPRKSASDMAHVQWDDTGEETWMFYSMLRVIF